MSGGSSPGPDWIPQDTCPKTLTLDVLDLVSMGQLSALSQAQENDAVFFRPGKASPVVELSLHVNPFVPFGVVHDADLYHCLSIGKTYSGVIVELDAGAVPPTMRVRAKRVG